MTTNRGKQHFPEATHNKGNQVDGKKVSHAVDEVIPHPRTGTSDRQRLDKGSTQTTIAYQSVRILRQEAVRLKTDIPHTEEHGGEGAQPHCDHNALEVNAVAHMGCGGSHAFWRIEDGVDGFVQGVPTFVLAIFFKMMLDAIEKLSDC